MKQKAKASYVTSAGSHFTPVVLTLPDGIDVNGSFSFKLLYDASDPGEVMHTGTGTANDPVNYTLPTGSLRLWTRDGSVRRGATEFDSVSDANLSTYGYYVPTNGDDDEYSAEDWRKLCIATGGHAGDRTVTLYLEAVDASTAMGDKTITFATSAGSDNGEDVPFVEDRVRVTTLRLRGAVDADLDGSVSLARDFTSEEHPFRFWVNENHDAAMPVSDTPGNAMSGSTIVDYELNDGVLDWQSDRISVKRDLEDFAQFQLEMHGPDVFNSVRLRMLPSHNYQVPVVKLWLAGVSDDSYLFDPTIAAGVVSGSLHDKKYVINEDGVTVSPAYLGYPGDWSDHYGRWNFIFEGCSIGRGSLEVSLLRDGIIVATSVVDLRISHITDMYERYSCDPAEHPYAGMRLDDSPDPEMWTDQNSDQYLLLVHGWNCSPFDRMAFGNSAFKRLYWQGYRGKFGTFNWPTEYLTDVGWTDAAEVMRNYDRSEVAAYSSGSKLLSLLTSLNAAFPGEVRLMAHSQGNMVASEALRLNGLAGGGQIVAAYLATQSAMTANAFDASVPLRSALYDTPDVYSADQHGNPYYGCIGYSAGKIINFYNPNDWALSSEVWGLNQTTKPDNFNGYGYRYDPGTDQMRFYAPAPSGVAWLDYSVDADRYVIFGRCAEAHSWALGRTPGVHGAISAELDLAAMCGFGEEHWYHSGEFEGNNMDVNLYWAYVRTYLGI